MLGCARPDVLARAHKAALGQPETNRAGDEGLLFASKRSSDSPVKPPAGGRDAGPEERTVLVRAAPT